MFIQALPFSVLNPFAKFLNFFAEADKDEDKTSKNEDDDSFKDDDLDAFSDEDDEEEGDKGKKKDDDESDDGDDDEGDKSKSGKKESSAIVQKKKYREQLKAANARIKELEGKKDTQGQLTEEQKKEQSANKFLADKIRDILKEDKSIKEKEEREAEEKFQDELDEILEANSDIKEKQILDVCEELGISPNQALKVIKREMKLKGKDKPNIPQPKRGSPEVDDKSNKDTKKKQSLDDVNRDIKKRMREGKL